jgi:hypothetical protein
MRYLQIISVYILLIVVLAACGPAESTPLVPEGQEPQTASPGSTPEGAQTQPSSPLLTPEDTDMTSPIPLDENAQKLVTLVKEHLAQRLGILVEQITLSELKPAVWRDGSLGCPKPAIDYIPMETPGYRIVLEAGGQAYTYHTNQTNRFVVCNRP